VERTPWKRLLPHIKERIPQYWTVEMAVETSEKFTFLIGCLEGT
jgi:hypothetical protein